MKQQRKRLVIVNQDVGYLFVDLANAALQQYDEVVLMSGSIVELGSHLDKRIQVCSMLRYRRNSVFSRFASWVLGAAQIALLLITRYRRYDVLASSNPPLNSLLPLVVGNRIGLYVLDLYPEALNETGMVRKNSLLVKLWRKLNACAYRRFDFIWTLTPSMRRVLKQNYAINAGFVPAWAGQMHRHKDSAVITKLGLTDRWMVLYSGNLGREHDVEVLLECASALQSQRKIAFVIAGEGWKKDLIVQRAAKEKLDNVMVLPKLPAGEFSALLAHAKIGVVTQSLRTAGVCIPSKTFNLLSTGLPVLGIGNPESDFGQLINAGGSGKVFNPDRVNEIIQFILSCASDESVRQAFRQRAIESAEAFTPRNAQRLVDELAGETSHA